MGGSNVLFTKDWPGLILKINLTGREMITEDEGTVQIQFAAGENWHEAVLYTVERGWGGLENLSLIPGQVGTAPVQNIGAYGVEIKDHFVSLTAINIEDLTRKIFNKADCQFGYRDSVFKRAEKGKWIILSVIFELHKDPTLKLDYGTIKGMLQTKDPTVADVSKAVIDIRQSKLPDPVEIGNGGSFFKNPIVSGAALAPIKSNNPAVPNYPVGENFKIPAAWLIDQAGWKGYRQGEAGVHDKQALVLINHGGATGGDIWQLAQDIQADVVTKFGIKLEPEINII